MVDFIIKNKFKDILVILIKKKKGTLWIGLNLGVHCLFNSMNMCQIFCCFSQLP